MINTKYDLKLLSTILMGLFYIFVGVNHFTDPYWFLQIVPPYLPYKIQLVYISGLLEVILGVMLLIPKTRFYAGWGLIVLLIAVYPANIDMFVNDVDVQTNVQGITERIEDADGVRLRNFIRLPFQFLFAWLVWRHTKQRSSLSQVS